MTPTCQGLSTANGSSAGSWLPCFEDINSICSTCRRPRRRRRPCGWIEATKKVSKVSPTTFRFFLYEYMIHLSHVGSFFAAGSFFDDLKSTQLRPDETCPALGVLAHAPSAIKRRCLLPGAGHLLKPVPRRRENHTASFKNAWNGSLLLYD